MNPWILLGQVVGTLFIVAGAWFYRGHIDATAKDDAIKTIEQSYQEKHDADVAKERQKTQEAQQQEKTNEYAYQHDKDQLQRALTDANDTGSRLRDAIKLYAAGFVDPNGATATGCVPISEANARIRFLAGAADISATATREDSHDLAACAVKLAACERWADTVESEFAVRP